MSKSQRLVGAEKKFRELGFEKTEDSQSKIIYKSKIQPINMIVFSKFGKNVRFYNDYNAITLDYDFCKAIETQIK